MLQVFGTLRIVSEDKQALVTASGGRLFVRPATLLQGLRLIRSVRLRHLPTLARLLDNLGLTLSVDSRAGFRFVVGRTVPGPILCALRVRCCALEPACRARPLVSRPSIRRRF